MRRDGGSKRSLLRGVNSSVRQESSVGAGEPRRLVEMSEISDPDLRWGAALVRRAGSIEPSRLMQARVRERLDAAQTPLRRNVRWVRWAPLAALLFAAGAGATIGRDWVRDFVNAAEEAPLAKPHGHDEHSGTGAPPRLAPIAAPEDIEPSPSLETTTAPVAPQHQVEAPRRTVARKAVTSTAASKGASASSQAAPASAQIQDQGSQLVVDALQARRAKRYTEASKLAQQYLTQYPRGPLAEEALGLVMEAASNTGSGQRHALARRYLQRFPNGRFTATAQRILQAP